MDYSANKFSKGHMTSEGVEAFARESLSDKGKTLDLTASYLREYGARDITTFEFLKDVTKLELGSNLIGPKGAKYLATSKVLTNLTSLNLFYNSIGNEGAMYIAISDNLLSLVNLNLSDNNITDEGAKALAKYMPLFTNLQVLDLRFNKIKEEGKEALKQAQKLTKLKQLLLDAEEGFQVKSI